MARRAVRWNQLSLRNKLTVVIVSLLTLGIVVAGIGTTLLLRPTLVGQLDAQLRAAAADPYNVVGGDPTTRRFTYKQIISAPQPYYVAVLDENGHVLYDNWGERPRAIAPDVSTGAEQSSGEEVRILEVHDGLGSPWRAIVLPEGSYTANQVFGTLVIALPMSSVNSTMAAFLAIFFGFGATVVIFGAALTRMLVSATLQPLRNVEATAISFAAGDYDQRLPESTPNTEVGRLSRSLNAMLGRIDTALEERDRTIEQMRRFVGDASHELRTPLVTVRGYAELYRMGALDEPEKVAQAMDRVEKEALRMGGLVEDLLQLARLDETRELVKDIVDLEPIAEDAAMDALAQAPHRRITALPVRIHADPADEPETERTAGSTAAGPAERAAPASPRPVRRRWIRSLRDAATARRLRRPVGPRPGPQDPETAVPCPESAEALLDVPAMIHANEDKVRQAVSNIVGNALRYTAEDSPLEVGVALDVPRRRAAVEIIDHGEGVPEQIRQKIFQRFWRADTSRTRETGGSGLGLAIVSAIMKAHDGSVEVVETPGGGATFRLVFPLLVAEPEELSTEGAVPRERPASPA
ncbi:MAG: ATP-binding protein [Pseudoclavibacter sp.]|nr:ATP-binding protein [Pseudoclavibacter sp.]